MDWQPRSTMATLTPHWLTSPAEGIELALFKIAERRTVQKKAVRQWLQTELSRRAKTDCSLLETVQGPIPDCGEWLISLSYCQEYVLCGFSNKGILGVDLTKIETFNDIDNVAELYFGKDWGKKAPEDRNKSHLFAYSWCELESRLKACKTALTEWSPERDMILTNSTLIWRTEFDGYALCVALQKKQASS